MSNIIFILYKITYAVYLKIRNRIKVVNKQLIRKRTPYFLFANHVNNWDPFFILANTENLVSYVANDHFFKVPILKNLLPRLRVIPKRKFMTDLDTVKKIFRAIKNGYPVGIFPEGRRTWDGVTEEPIGGIAKLVQKTGLPVVTCKIKGGMLAYPRWAKNSRRGVVELEFNEVLKEGEAKHLSVEEIYRIIKEGIYHDEMQWQEENRIKFKGKRRAESLEKLLFMCPKCKEMNSLYSKGEKFSCKACHNTVKYNEYGFFEGNEVVFKNTRDWNGWQKSAFEEQLQSKTYTLKARAKVTSEETGMDIKEVGTGSLTYSNGRVYFEYGEKNTEFEVMKITGSNVQKNDIWQFYYGKICYRVEFYEENIFAYQWNMIHTILKNRNDNWRENNGK
jgi:1-acyl-sn-glycerol-3-phosphate acyltransferase